MSNENINIDLIKNPDEEEIQSLQEKQESDPKNEFYNKGLKKRLRESARIQMKSLNGLSKDSKQKQGNNEEVSKTSDVITSQTSVQDRVKSSDINSILENRINNHENADKIIDFNIFSNQTLKNDLKKTLTINKGGINSTSGINLHPFSSKNIIGGNSLPQIKASLKYSEKVETPNLLESLSNSQIDKLLGNVNMNNTFLQMATNDHQLVQEMKETIEYQQSIIKKREKLVYAITHNIKYLAQIHKQNQLDLRLIKEKLDSTTRWNERLQDQNEKLSKECEELRKSQQELNQATEKINTMLIDSQADKDLINQQYEQIENKQSEMEKLKLEVTIVVTEKVALKKDLDRVDGLYHKMQKDFREQRVQFELLVDEISKVNKQNSEYRGLILENETKLSDIGKEIQTLQKKIELKNKLIQQANEETGTYKKQIEKLLEELREKSDSESFDDEKERIMNVKKAQEGELLKERVKYLTQEAKGKEADHDAEIQRYESNLNFSRNANMNLKKDYDLLQEKFDKHMKATNNLNQDLKEEIDQLNDKCSQLQIYKDDHLELIQAEREKMKKEMLELSTEKESEVKTIQAEMAKLKAELDNFKNEFQMKMTQVKLMEMELQEKLEKANEAVDD